MLTKEKKMRTSLLTVFFTLLVTALMARSAYKVEGNNVIVNLDGYGVKSKLLKVELWSNNTARVVSTMNEEFKDQSLLFGQPFAGEIKFKVAYSQNDIEITTSDLYIVIEESGLIRLMSRDGRKLLVESDRSYEPSESHEGMFRISQSFFLSRKEHVYGFGQNCGKPHFNLRDQSFDLVQNESDVANPVFFSEKGYALIWDNFSATRFEDTPAALKISSELADEISFFMISGPQFDQIINEIRNITGKAKLLPQWAYNFHLNPMAYASEQDLKQAIGLLKSKNINVAEESANTDLHRKEMQINTQAGNEIHENARAFHALRDEFSAVEKNGNTRVAVATHINLPGIQQYGSFSTAGMVKCSWESLQNQVQCGITASLSGQPHWSTTIGGNGQHELSNDGYNELLLRWFQFASFTPVFQGPAVSGVLESLLNASDEQKEAFESTLLLRKQLLPYYYSLAADAVLNNKSIMRSLLFDYPDQERLHSISNQYLLGKYLMPVTISSPDAKQQQVLLPEGTPWYDFFTGEKLDGGKTIQRQPGIKSLPLMVKAGAVIPMQLSGNEGDESLIEIRIYRGADGAFVLYNDEGTNKDYLNGAHTYIAFNYDEKKTTLTIEALEGEFPGMPATQNFRIVWVDETNGIGTNPADKYQEVAYKGKKVKVKFE
jgi:alpha-glucosidase (family GH31 glycosyl hydrolase)